MAEEIRFTPPPKLLGYLTLLARDTLLGSTASEVALHLVTIEAERRLHDDYQAKAVPIADPPPKREPRQKPAASGPSSGG